MSKYPFETIEPKWQKFWDEQKTFKTTEDQKFPKEKRMYVLDMFPYPSAAGLHVGHPEGYTATDIYCRYLRMNGFHKTDKISRVQLRLGSLRVNVRP